ncbi:hypothetical protein [Streptomyces curacoi]|uniref:hypothetical protein n=1 Tax=Streptomyces curacoi TaxID=146536 RepID=UPI000AB43C6A|nr:hypothetical protein [Streptomyces curacoi]
MQVVHEWDTAVQVQDNEATPPHVPSPAPNQAFFDHADEQVERIRGRGRKEWLPAFRDAVAFKTAYGYGLRPSVQLMPHSDVSNGTSATPCRQSDA